MEGGVRYNCVLTQVKSWMTVTGCPVKSVISKCNRRKHQKSVESACCLTLFVCLCVCAGMGIYELLRGIGCLHAMTCVIMFVFV